MGPLDLLTSRQALAQPMGLRSSDDARRRARSVHGPFESITIRREDRPNMTEMPIDAPPSTNTRAVRLTEIARIFLKIGAMSYGVGDHAGATGEKGAGHAAAFAVRFGAGAGHGGIADRRSHSARR